MTNPYGSDDRPDAPAAGWQGVDSDATQVVPPQLRKQETPSSGAHPAVEPERLYSGQPEAPSEHPDPFSHPMPTIASPPVGAPMTGPGPEAPSEPGGWTPGYSSQPAVTSVYPPSTPGYAPAGYPPAYAPASVVQPPPSSALPTEPASRVGPAFLSALIGLILSVGGVYLAAKYGVAAAGHFNQQSLVIKDSALATVGGILLLAAVVLNGWSPWATVLPGVVLTGLGGWALFSTSAVVKLADWTKWAFSGGQLSAWHITGFTLVLGLVMIAASVATAIARAGGKRAGEIVARRHG